MRRHIFLLLTCCLVILPCIQAQNPKYLQFAVNEGLPSNEVYHVLQDSKGYLWFSTDKGVSRYDGYDFTNFTTDDGLTDNTVFFSYEDEEGNIWFLSYSPRLCYYDGQSIKAFRYNASIDGENLERNPKVSFYKEGNVVYVGTNNRGGYVIDENGKLNMLLEKPGTNVITAGNGHLIYKVPGNAVNNNVRNQLHVFDETYEYPRSTKLILRLVKDGDKLYFSDGSNVFAYDNGHLKHLLKTNKTIASLFISKNRSLWISTLAGGVSSYSLLKDTIRLNQTFFNGKSISWITEDHEGGMWFTSLDEGVYYRAPNAGMSPPFLNDLPKEEVREIQVVSKDKAFVSYADGSIWQIEDGTCRNLQIKATDPVSLTYNPIAWDARQLQLITVETVGRYFEQNNNRLISLFEKLRNRDYPDDLKFAPQIRQIKTDDLGRVWVGTNDGLYAFKDGQLTNFVNSSSDSASGDKAVQVLYKIDAIGIDGSRVYASAVEGLNRVHANFFEFMGNENELLSSRIDAIGFMNDGSLLLGSRGRGLIFYTDNSIYVVNRDKGLGSNLINAIEVDATNTIWVGTNKGLNRLIYSEQDVEVKRVSSAGVLPSSYVNSLASRGEELWIGGLKGLAIVHGNELAINQIAPKLILERLTVNDVNTDMDTTKSFKFEQNTLSFKYTAIGFKSGGQLDYEYRMRGIDQQFRKTRSREVRYNKLPFGDYTFEVRASNEDGYWSEPLSFHFTILPPFYLRWYFIVFTLGSFLAFVSYVMFRRERRLRESSLFLQRSAELELKALRAQMNPHFTFNTLSAIQQYILQNDSVKANDYLSKFASLIRKVLENSRHGRIRLSEELESLEIYISLEKMRFPGKFDHQLKIHPGIDLDGITVPPALIQPFVENAILHGIAHKVGSGNITIELIEFSGGVKCIISDDGIGREKAQEIKKNSRKHKVSLGLQITKDRLDLLKESSKDDYGFKTVDLYDNSGKAIGTRVEITISH